MKILITGAAGFIGYHLCDHLEQQGHVVVGIDNINDYYDPMLKFARLSELGINDRESSDFGSVVQSSKRKNFRFVRMDLQNKEGLKNLFQSEKFEIVCHLAAQAGVRYSIKNPSIYIESNIVGFFNILECSRNHAIKHLIYASSSSVYGQNKKIPFSIEDNVDNPLSLYAATKKSNELMAYSYSHLYNIPTSGLRFFTVYGPWGRPDMAIYLFADAIAKGRPIKVFNNGDMLRDFTYIDDIVHGIELVVNNPPSAQDSIPYRLSNIGKGSPQSLNDFIKEIETSMGIKTKRDNLPMQLGDVPRTWADTSDLELMGYTSSTNLREGVSKFITWYKKYHKL